jgi:hypothetical protein
MVDDFRQEDYFDDEDYEEFAEEEFEEEPFEEDEQGPVPPESSFFDDIREEASDSPFFADLEEESQDTFDYADFAGEPPSRSVDRLLGMTPAQRLVIAVMLLGMVCILSAFCLLVTERIALPF